MNPQLKEKTLALGKILKDTMVSGLDAAVFHTEYVIRHKGAKHLRSPVNDLYWFQYQLLDVLLFLGALVCLVIYILYIFIICIFRAICCRSKNNFVKKNQ